jgi:hypothetical protein
VGSCCGNNVVGLCGSGCAVQGAVVRGRAGRCARLNRRVLQVLWSRLSIAAVVSLAYLLLTIAVDVWSLVRSVAQAVSVLMSLRACSE